MASIRMPAFEMIMSAAKHSRSTCGCNEHNTFDNANGNMSPGNKIQLWQLENGDTNQQWTELAAIMLKNLAA